MGALSTEAVILDPGGEISGYSIVETGANSTEAAEEAFNKALSAAGIRRNAVENIVATGYGRISVPFAERRVTEISCHAIGAQHLFPDTGTVIDIGGHPLKGRSREKTPLRAKKSPFLLGHNARISTASFSPLFAPVTSVSLVLVNN